MMKEATEINELSAQVSIAALALPCITQYLHELHTRVYAIFLGSDFDTRSAATFLSSQEMVRATAMKDERAKRHFTVGRAVLRLVLAQSLDVPVSEIEFDYSFNGKPFVKKPVVKPRPGFSISHAWDRIVIGVSPNGDIGIDIELMIQRKNMDRVLQSVFSPLDCEWVVSENGQRKLERFYRIWCRREAVLKAYGKGARYPTRNIDWHLVPTAPACLPDDPLSIGTLEPVYIKDIDVFPECAASVALIAS